MAAAYPFALFPRLPEPVQPGKADQLLGQDEEDCNDDVGIDVGRDPQVKQAGWQLLALTVQGSHNALA